MDETRAVDATDVEVVEQADARRAGVGWKRWLKRIAIGVGVTIAVLAALAATLYSFGGMERPAPGYRAEYDRLVAQGAVPSIEGRFTIPIPGCRCHSTDPVQQVLHSTYRIRECMGCHAGR